MNEPLDRAKNLDEAVAAGAEAVRALQDAGESWTGTKRHVPIEEAVRAVLTDPRVSWEGLVIRADLSDSMLAAAQDLVIQRDESLARIEALEALLREASSWMGGMSTKSQTAEEELRDWLARYRAVMGEET